MTERELYERYHKDIYRACYHMLGRSSAAEDVFLEVFVQAFSSPERLMQPIKAGLVQLAMNGCMHHLQQRQYTRKKSSMPLQFEASREAASIPDRMEEQEREEEWRRRMGRLPEEIRMVIVMRYTNELTYHEIARVLNVPLATVMSRMNIGLRLLRPNDGHRNVEAGEGGARDESSRQNAYSAVGR